GALLRGDHVDLASSDLITEEIEIDLFDEPAPVRLANAALELSEQEPRLTGQQIAAVLGTTRRSCYDAIKLGTLMRERGLAEPYIELKGPPDTASRWRPRRRHARREDPEDARRR
ncbi:hypothetical protein LCGC14_2357610, partial [marine sediment metagenome]